MKYPSAKKFIITEQYYKRSRPNQSLAQYEAWRTKNPTVVRAIVKKDPALRNHPRLEREVVKHEVRELKLGYTKYKDRSKPSRAQVVYHFEMKLINNLWRIKNRIKVIIDFFVTLLLVILAILTSVFNVQGNSIYYPILLSFGIVFGLYVIYTYLLSNRTKQCLKIRKHKIP